MDRQAVITGMGAITPLGNDVKTTWNGIAQGRSGIGSISVFDAATFPVRIAGEVKGFTPDASNVPRDMQILAGRSALMCMEATKMAVHDAGIDWMKEPPEKIGISLGGDEEYLRFDLFEKIYDRDHTYRAFVGGENAHGELLKYSTLLAKVWAFRKRADIGTKMLALTYNIQGPLESSHTACSSSGHAIGKAKRLIENGDCDVVITGGHCSMVSEFSVTGFHLLGTLSTNNDDPTRASRPFDRDRDGFILGEGSGILIVEEARHAKRRGARIYARLSGYGSSSNAYRLTDTPPDGRGGDLAMRRALQDARLDVSQVDYINAHGTGTMLNDRSETRSIKNIFGPRAYSIPISSSKSMLGHLVCSSSAVELIVSVMALQENVIPPTINLETPDPECDLDYVPGSAREQKLQVALSNSFAFGGQNSTLVLEKYRQS